jgi:hypothetical protein
MTNYQDSQTALVGNFTTLQSAEIAAGLLRNNGIPCEVNNRTIASVLPMTDTWTPLSLIVPESMAEKAQAILADVVDTSC